MVSKQEEIQEMVAVKLYIWLHSSSSPDFNSKKTPEVVRVGYRKRARELLAEMTSRGVVIKEERLTEEEIAFTESQIFPELNNG